jgi:hypothetical protein
VIGQAVAALPGRERFAVVASGHFSLEIAGPQSGLTDRAWVNTVLGCLSDGRTDDLVEQATTDRMLAAGNVSGELLNWIAMLGVIGNRRPTLLEPQGGHAYAAWRWE